MTDMSFLGTKGKQLLETIKSRLINHFSIYQDLDTEQGKVVIDFLQSPKANYTEYSLWFK